MTAIEDDIQLLIQIVKKDVQIEERKKFLEGAPEKIGEIDAKINEMEDEFNEIKEGLERLNKERRHLEGDIETQNAKLQQKKLESSNIKSNEAFRAITKEIEYLEKMIYKEEERVLEILEQSETKRKEIEEIGKKFEGEKAALLEDRKRLELLKEKYEQQLQIFRDEKERVLPHLSEQIKNLYNRITSVKGDSGVANLVEDICQGCYSRVPPQKAHEVRRNDRIITCEVCGRILVFFPIDLGGSQ
jgi:predicted  nucleic acid-binding Zn-ribbon protein